MTPTPTCDLEIRIDTATGKKLLDALAFPLRMDFAAEPAGEQAVEIAEATVSGAEEKHESLEAVLEDVLNQPLISHIGDANERNSTLADGGKTKPQVDAERDGEKRYDIQLAGLSVIMPSKPQLATDHPLTLTGVNLQIRVRLKVGVRALRWYWKELSTPWLDLRGNEAKVKLTADGGRLLAMPELADTNLALNVKIWKWNLRCNLRVSKLINRQFANHGPFPVVDFADLNRGAQFLGKQPHFAIQEIVEVPQGVVIRSNIEWQ